MQLLAFLALGATAALASPLHVHQPYSAGSTPPTTANATYANATASIFADCGGKPYVPGTYVCYPGSQLCPVVGGTATLPCDGACYDPTLYSCSAGALVQQGSSANATTVAVYPGGMNTPAANTPLVYTPSATPVPTQW